MRLRLCEIDLIDLGAGPEPRHLVNVRQGLEGGALRETSRTPNPVTRAEAERLFDSVLVARLNEGYRQISGAGPAIFAAQTQAPNGQASGPESRRGTALARALSDLAEGRLSAQAGDRLLFRVGLLAAPAFGAGALTAYRKMGAQAASSALIYALARCARADAAEALETIGRESGADHVRDLARAARASLWMGDLARPDPKDDLALAHAPDLATLFEREKAQAGAASAALIALARRGPLDQPARAKLLQLLAQGTPLPPLQRAYRRLLKIAELCDDAPLFAEVGRAFEITPPMYKRRQIYRGGVYVAGAGYVELAPQRTAASPLLALSDKTSHYMRRRVWRILRKRGELGHASFAAMASALAARFEDGDMAGGDQTPAAPFRRVRRLWSLAHLSYGADSTLNFNSSRVTVTGAPRQVAPLFIDLWRRDVEGVLHLAQNARSAPGRALAAKLLAEIDAKRLSDHVLQLANIAAGPHEDLASLAARLLEPFVAAPDVSCGLLARVLDTRHEGLRRIALMAVDARGPWSEAALGLAALLARQPETIARVEAWIARAPTQPQLTALAEAFVERLAQAPADLTPEQAETFGLAARRLMQLAQGRALGLPAQRFAAFADHPAPGVRAAGLDLLAASGLPLDDLPHDFWTRGLNAPDAVLRAAAARLLGALSDEALARHADHVRAAVFDPDPAPRAAIRPAAAKLAARDPVFAEALYRAVTPHLFQSEPSEGFADDLAALIETALTQPRDAMRVDELWRMLRAQARGARLVSAGALAARADEIFDARRWARLTAHPMKTVRQRALAVFDAHEDWFRADPGAAAQLLDTRWEDVRAGALERLSRWPASAFSVEALAELADAADPGAQADARALLRRTIQPGAGGPTLARLMEHPSPAFQLFVTEILATEKLDTPALFERFLDAARIALFRVHAGRAVKARLWARLSNEACASRARAEAALPLIAQMSLSAVERDRAPALALLRDLRLAFPDLETPLALTRRAS